MIVEVSIPLIPLDTAPLPVQHGYALFGALSTQFGGAIHETPCQIAPIRGNFVPGENAHLVIPSPHPNAPFNPRILIRTDEMSAGAFRFTRPKLLQVAGKFFALQPPRIQGIMPWAHLWARCVTFSGARERAHFEACLQKDLGWLDPTKIRIGRRRVVSVKDLDYVGYEVKLSQLSPEESCAIQASGVGGKKHMGAGVFLGTAPAFFGAQDYVP